MKLVLLAFVLMLHKVLHIWWYFHHKYYWDCDIQSIYPDSLFVVIPLLSVANLKFINSFSFDLICHVLFMKISHKNPIYKPALRAIKTSVPMYRCCVAHSPVMRLGNIAPSSRIYCFRISTSVCLISKPSVHFGQNLLSLDFTSFISWFSRGDDFNSAFISNTLPFCSTLTEWHERKKN